MISRACSKTASVAFCRGVMAATLLIASGCGDDGGAAGSAGGTDAQAKDSASVGGDVGVWPALPESSVTRQDSLKESDLVAVKVGCFSDALSSVEGSGYDTFGGAGVTAAGTVEVTWAEMRNSSGDFRVAVARCDGADCVCSVGRRTADGAALEGTDGTAQTLTPVGAPVLAKTLTDATKLDSPTKLDTKEGGLLEEPLPSLDPKRFVGKRRFIVANAFGDAFGATFTGLVRKAEDSGGFTEVEEKQYVRRDEIDEALSSLHGQDVLVWFAHGVRVSKGKDGNKPEGMTVNVGLFGDETYSRERIEEMVKDAPLGGPGLLVLAGGETFGSAEKGLAPFSALEHLVRAAGRRDRVVVGFRGLVSAEDAMVSLGAMFDAWFGGATLADAIADANAELSARGSEATVETNLDAVAQAAYTFLPAPANYWNGAPPSGGDFVGYLLVSGASSCDKGDTVEQTVQFFTSVTFDGPFFEGKKDEDGVDIEVFGLLEQLGPGARMKVWMRGTPNSDMTDVTVLGDGRFCVKGECSGDVAAESAFKVGGGNLYFAGAADATTYENGQGGTCTLVKPPLTQKGGKPGWITLEP